MIEVSLTKEEMKWAAHVGCDRHIESKFRKHRNRIDGIDKSQWEIDIDGAAAELAVAKALGIEWTAGVCTYKAADLGENLQVRSTDKPTGSLVVRPKDNPDHVYILAVGKPPTFTVYGFINGKDAQNMDWWKNPGNRGGAWFVPQTALTPIETMSKPQEVP